MNPHWTMYDRLYRESPECPPVNWKTELLVGFVLNLVELPDEDTDDGEGGDE